jgi:Flp pilus assembly protein TadG
MARDDHGGVAVMFGVSALVLCLCTGLALDVGRSIHAQNHIGAAADAAALAAAQAMRARHLTEAEAEAFAKSFFDANMNNSVGTFSTITSFAAKADAAKGEVKVDVAASVQTIFGKLAGINELAVPSSSVAVVDGQDIEVAVQLDVTGSMSGQKIADLKVAMKDLINIVVPSSPGYQKVRVGFVPFSAGVNAGSYAAAVNGGRGQKCVYERNQAALQSTDVSPAGVGFLKVKPDLAGPVQNCPGAEVVPLKGDKAGDKDDLLKAVDKLAAGGTTAGQLGTAWAWYLLSPIWDLDVWKLTMPVAAYGDKQTLKIAILMTDGEYNTVGGVMSGPNQAIAAQMAKDTCEAMKKPASSGGAGLTVYTIGFQINVPAADDVLLNCASEPGKYFKPQTGGDLQSVFRQIANEIVSLRLTH